MPHFTHEQQQEMLGQMFFPRHVIGDYNGEGFDSVESEDHSDQELRERGIYTPPPPKAQPLPKMVRSGKVQETEADRDKWNQDQILKMGI